MIRRFQNWITPHTALTLYGLMLVLPAGIFGLLYWRELIRDQEERTQRAPADAANTARRMQRQLTGELEELLFEESQRSFTDFAPIAWQDSKGGGIAVETSLVSAPRPPGILTWFSFHEEAGTEAIPTFFFGGDDEQALELEGAGDLAALVQSKGVEATAKQARGAAEIAKHSSLPWRSRWDDRGKKLQEQVDIGAAAFYLHPDENIDCTITDLRKVRRNLPGTKVTVSTSDQRYLLTQDRKGRLRLLGMRNVRLHPLSRDPVHDELLPICLEDLGNANSMVQGWVADAEWFLRQRPREIAENHLGADQHLFLASEQALLDPEQWAISPISILQGTDIRIEGLPSDADRFYVGVDVSSLDDRFRSQRRWFAGLVGILGTSTLLGLSFLIGRVRSSAEAARRTENFVASITHELRTPLAAVKMYGEMLSAGWASTPDKQKEYADRIVGQSNRLDSLVDRVLEKRRLSGAPPQLAAGDLNAELRRERTALDLDDDPSVRFDLADELPRVLLTEEAIHAVLSNLLENARKYAPVDTTDPEAEPLLVRTRLVRRRVTLEVLDRGPGISAAERSKIFDAFYRVGNEATRTTQGTGLGLHLVAQYARTLKGRVSYAPREGGGSRFRIVFRKA